MKVSGRALIILLSGSALMFVVFTPKGEPYRQLRPIFYNESSDCSCSIDNGGHSYDFCYRLPENSSVVGKKFSCAHLPSLIDLGLHDKSEALDTETDVMPEPVFVMAFSENHAPEARAQILSLRKYFPNKRFYIYDMGLGNQTKTEFKKVCNVELRSFHFGSYPVHVRSLKEYRWKPIIIAETLKEFGAIWYLDTSVTFTRSNLSSIENMIACRFKSHSSYGKVGCKKSGYLLHSPVSHSIFSTTTPGMFNFLPSNNTLIKRKSASMFAAGFVLVVKTADALETLKWYVLCALQSDCMAPKGHKLSCKFGKNLYDIYAGCNRYDQSTINILLFNQYDHNSTLYAPTEQGYYRIERGQKATNISSLYCK